MKTPEGLKAQVEGIRKPTYIGIEGRGPIRDYRYSFGFIFEHPNGPYIKIDSEPRRDFIAKGTEAEAQDALVAIAKATRLRSGGVFSVHPFFGAVWGTKLTPVSSGFLTESQGLGDDLTMFVYLTDHGDKFDGKLTQISSAVGTVVSFPSETPTEAVRGALWLHYMGAPKTNPNQSDRDQAIANGLGEQWDQEFSRYNKTGRVPHAMPLNTNTIVELMSKLESEAGVTDLKVVDSSHK